MFPKYHMGHTYTKQLFIIYLAFKFKFETCILSGNLNY